MSESLSTPSDGFDAEVSDLILERYRRGGAVDPTELGREKAIGYVLIKAAHMANPNDSVYYLDRMIGKTGEPLNDNEYVWRNFMLKLIKEGGDANDEIIAGIEQLLLSTKERSRSLPELRVILLRLIELRGADDVEDEQQIKRWNVVIRKLGEAAL